MKMKQMKAWRILLCLIGMVPLIPMVADEHLAHRVVWCPIAVWGFLWAMAWAQEDGAKRKG